MITIASVADHIGEYIGEQAELQSEVKKICYGVECTLVLLINIGIILALGWLCGAFKETALITLAALVMKHIIGGPHLSGFVRCTVLSTVILAGAGWAFKTLGAPSPWWLLVLAIAGCGIIWLYGPLFAADFHCSGQQIKFRKLLGVFFLALLSIFNIWFYSRGLIYLNIGALVTVSLRTPAGVLIVNGLEQLTKGKEAQST
jgi:accessory gene regulator protein AgrB